MTKSTKYGKVIYNFLDHTRDNVEITYLQITKPIIQNIIDMQLKYDIDCDCDCVTSIRLTQETAKDLIKVLQEFAETGELK
jgi:hypothetical protein